MGFLNRENTNQVITDTGIDLDAKLDNLDAQLADYTKITPYAVDTGSANTYVITPNPAITAYVAGQNFKFTAINANTGACTLNVNGLGAKAIKKNVSTALVLGDIKAGQVINCIYDGTNFQIIPDTSSDLDKIPNGLTRMQLIASTAGWSTSLTGSGSSSSFPSYLYVASGATASSVAIAYARLLGNDIAGTQSRVNYAKTLRISFVLSVSDVANSIKYIQIKTATTHGDLAEKGLGIKLNNLSLKGESYGTARQEIALMDLSVGTEYLITIDFIPGVKIIFYVNGVVKGTISDTANIPTGITASNTNYLVSTSNDSTALGSNIYISPITMRAEV